MQKEGRIGSGILDLVIEQAHFTLHEGSNLTDLDVLQALRKGLLHRNRFAQVSHRIELIESILEQSCFFYCRLVPRHCPHHGIEYIDQWLVVVLGSCPLGGNIILGAANPPEGVLVLLVTGLNFFRRWLVGGQPLKGCPVDARNLDRQSILKHETLRIFVVGRLDIIRCDQFPGLLHVYLYRNLDQIEHPTFVLGRVLVEDLLLGNNCGIHDRPDQFVNPQAMDDRLLELLF